MMVISRSTLVSIGWWAATLLTLVVLDDLTYGPIFWAISQFHTFVAVALAFLLYWAVQVLLVREGTREQPGRLAEFFLRRLRLERGRAGIAKREATLHDRVTGPFLALALAPVIGGVIPPLVMSRQGHSVSSVRRLSVATAAIYAAEFAYLHAYLPSVFVG